MVFDMEITGFEGLRRFLSEAPQRVKNKHVRRANRQGAVIVRDRIKANAPIREDEHLGLGGDIRPPPGRLKRLVRVRGRRGKRGYVAASVIYPREGDANDPKNAFYWRFVEFGTKRMRPIPFIQRSADQEFKRVVKHIFTETRRGLSEELGRTTR